LRRIGAFEQDRELIFDEPFQDHTVGQVGHKSAARSSVLQQIVDIAKQSCGGNLDMAIRTQQVRDLIQLYAMSTGQQTKGMLVRQWRI